jgi:hypothetical protein
MPARQAPVMIHWSRTQCRVFESRWGRQRKPRNHSRPRGCSLLCGTPGWESHDGRLGRSVIDQVCQPEHRSEPDESGDPVRLQRVTAVRSGKLCSGCGRRQRHGSAAARTGGILTQLEQIPLCLGYATTFPCVARAPGRERTAVVVPNHRGFAVPASTDVAVSAAAVRIAPTVTAEEVDSPPGHVAAERTRLCVESDYFLISDGVEYSSVR